MKEQMIDILIPAYNEGAVICDNIRTIHEQLKNDGISHRFIIVNDGSTDNTWEQITKLNIPDLLGVCLSRNFGKEAALCAGLMEVTAPCCVVMDSDLQHPPRMIKQMLEKWNEGNLLVECVKASRGKESFFSRLFAKVFYSVFRKLAGFDFDNSSDFKLIDRQVIEAWKQMGDTSVFFRGMIEWTGFEKVQIPFEVEERSGGESKFSRLKLIKLAVNAITSYSSKPLMLTAVIGFIFFIAAFFLLIQTIYNKFFGMAVSGFTTVIILILVVGGLILFCMAVIGTYISRIFDEVKGRPRYIVSKKTGRE